MSQTQAIVEYCNKHGSITSNEATKALGMLSFNRRMTTLKERGYEFASAWETVPSRYGKGTAKVLRYRITKQPRSK